MSDHRQIKLILFFTRPTSLRNWDEVGMFEREVALYQCLQEHCVQVTFVTYGDASDLRYADRIPGIRIVCNRWNLSRRRHLWLLTRVYPWLWRGRVVFKSNQVKGANIALGAARRFGRKFIARCGYLYSEFTERQHGADSPHAQKARTLEEDVFTTADRVVVTTPAMRDTVMQRYQVPSGRVTVIPNYVQTEHFCPNPNGHHTPNRLCFVGRLAEQKNPFALLEAIQGLELELLMVGDGTLSEQLRDKVEANSLPVRFLGNVPNHQLPQILNSVSLFILPSHYEGHPKTLLEAMSCGLPVIGTDVPGIRELIEHRHTGYLCGTSPEEIRAAIQEVLGDAELQARMGRNAREFVVEQFALERIVEMELAVLRELAG